MMIKTATNGNEHILTDGLYYKLLEAWAWQVTELSKNYPERMTYAEIMLELCPFMWEELLIMRKYREKIHMGPRDASVPTTVRDVTRTMPE
jgi:hypothetical protein